MWFRRLDRVFSGFVSDPFLGIPDEAVAGRLVVGGAGFVAGTRISRFYVKEWS